jgi:low affinity Fe/Cu permease
MAKPTTVVDQRLDKLAEAIVSIARAEEKLVQLENDKKFLMERMVKVEEKTAEHQQKLDEHTTSISIMTRLSWIAISSIIAGAATALLSFVSH